MVDKQNYELTLTSLKKIKKFNLKPQNSLEDQIGKYLLMPKLQKQISKYKTKKVVIESNLKNKVRHPIYKNIILN